MKVLSWNVHGATATSGVWDYLLEAEPDIALLQEVGTVPASVAAQYEQLSGVPVTKTGKPQRFKTVILSKLPFIEPLRLRSDNAWVEEQAKFFQGNLLAATLCGRNGEPVHVLSVYAPAWPIERTKWHAVDVTGLKLAANRDVWCTEIMWDLLRHTMPSLPSQWIVGGDFNSSETFDFRVEGDRGNREVMARLNALGFAEALRTHHGRLVPTYRNVGSKKIIHQLDHLYVTSPLRERLVMCQVGDADRVIWSGLSDHLPIMATFEVDVT